LGDLLKWVLIEHCPANDVFDVIITAAAKICDKSGFTTELQELAFDHIKGAKVARRDDGGPQCS
jgi:hypothetical protein